MTTLYRCTLADGRTRTFAFATTAHLWGLSSGLGYQVDPVARMV